MRYIVCDNTVLIFRDNARQSLIASRYLKSFNAEKKHTLLDIFMLISNVEITLSFHIHHTGLTLAQ